MKAKVKPRIKFIVYGTIYRIKMDSGVYYAGSLYRYDDSRRKRIVHIYDYNKTGAIVFESSIEDGVRVKLFAKSLGGRVVKSFCTKTVYK